MSPATDRYSFELPTALSATAPPEARGLRRDAVRLLIASNDSIDHARFHDLTRWLDPGDLIVVNTSATLPAAVDGALGEKAIGVHFSAPLDDGSWVVELRSQNGAGPLREGRAGAVVDLAGGGRLVVLSAYAGIEGRSRMVRVRPETSLEVEAYLQQAGRAISYPYVPENWPLSMYQTVFALHPGSAEMPSAGRPFTTELVTALVSKGVGFTPLVLHTGVSSLERDETPLPERFTVDGVTARRVNETRASGGRVIAVGTSAVRALESSVGRDGTAKATNGWTDLILGPERRPQIVDGLITGWHTSEASHLMLLEALAGSELVAAAYENALREGYLWHEFGDSCFFRTAR